MYGNFDKPFTFDKVVRLVIGVLLIVSGISIIYILKSVLLPFFVAWIIAYILNPAVRFFQQKLRIRNRVLAVTITLFLAAGLIALLIVLLIPVIEAEVYQINALIHSYQSRLGALNLNVNGIPVKLQDFILNHIDFTKLSEALSKQNAADTMQYVVPAITGVVSNTISAILSLTIIFVVLLYLIFILIDYDKINTLWRTLIPARYLPQVNKVVVNIEKNMNIYFRHQFFICLILCVLYALGFQLVGLPLAIMLGIFVGLLHMVPYMQVISFVPALLLCWLKAAQTGQSFWGLIALVALVYLVLQCILELFLTPRIMGKAMGLNPAIILLSLSIWGYLLGIIGMIIAIPLTTLLLYYYQSFIASIPDNHGESGRQ
jgi:predicted PurR-regulated permease PerM